MKPIIKPMNQTGQLIVFNKPFGVICQFSPHEKHASLKEFIPIEKIYPAGRLDTDSEGLLLLTDNGRWQAQIADPKHKLVKTYWAQLEGNPEPEKLALLQKPLDLGDFIAKPAQIRLLSDEETAKLWARNPPIRVRQNIPDFWLEIRISEGKNRQVRRMTAKAGLPCLRLVRVGIGRVNLWDLDLNLGEYQAISFNQL